MMIYYDRKNDRILLPNGVSILSSFGYAKKIIEGVEIPENVKVFEDEHSIKYDFLNKTEISQSVDVTPPQPDEHQHTEDELEYLLERVSSSERYKNTEKFNDRLSQEIEYFERTLNIRYLLICLKIVDNMKEKGIVWGIGRGSSCASLLCYVLHINDVNPLEYDINFSELSKE